MAEDLLFALWTCRCFAVAGVLQLPYNKPANPKFVISTGTTDNRTVHRAVKTSSIA
jgi:hypothetical protein